MEKHDFKIRERLRSFRYAFSGLRTLFASEHNVLIHLIAALLAVAAAIIFKISAAEWIAITIAIGVVFASEAFNTSIEKLSDYVSPDKHISIREVKDLAAAGVLISAVTALVIGLIIFVPKIKGLLS